MECSKKIVFILILCTGLCITSAFAGMSYTVAPPSPTDTVQINFGDDGLNAALVPKTSRTEGDAPPEQMYIPGVVIVVYEVPEMAAIHSNDALSATANAGIDAVVTESYDTGVLPGYQVVSLP